MLLALVLHDVGKEDTLLIARIKAYWHQLLAHHF